MVFPVSGTGTMQWVLLDVDSNIISRSWSAQELIIEDDGNPGSYDFVRDNNTTTSNIIARFNDGTTTTITGTFITTYNLYDSNFRVFFNTDLIAIMYFHCNSRLFLDKKPTRFRFKVPSVRFRYSNSCYNKSLLKVL